MAFRRNEELDLNQVTAFLQDAVNKVRAGDDLEALEQLKQVFKKNVPLTLRSYVAAYLLKNARGAIYHFNNHHNRDDFRPRHDDERRPRYERTDRIPRDDNGVNREHSGDMHERAPRVQIDPSVAATVFVGIGRNRRVFPRDLVGLFISVAGLERERIGDIRVLANYSFVQLFAEDAEKAINALNGYDYRGRKLSVSYSKQRETAETDTADEERVPDVENKSAPVADSFTTTTNDTVAQQAAFAAQQEAATEMTDEEILAARAPRSSSSEDLA